MARSANTLPVLAAWLHIGPDESDFPADCPPVGIQRLHTAEVEAKLRDNSVSLSFLPGHLALSIVSALTAVAGHDVFERDYFAATDALQAAMAEHGNVEIDMGGGMLATVCPAEPTSGANLSRSAPVRISL